MSKQSILLENKTDPPRPKRQLRDIEAIEENPSLIGWLETRNQPEQGCLSRSGRPQDADKLARRDLERYVINDRPGTKTPGDILQLKFHDASPLSANPFGFPNVVW
jgi:hypothetical protein